jgi:uncharacterized protein (TIRG00374 family)
MGELVRTYLISAKSRVALSSSLAAIVLERILDLACVLVVLLLLIINIGVPAWVIRTGCGISAILVAGILSALVLLYRGKSVVGVLKPINSKLPSKWLSRIEGFVPGFLIGLAVVRSRKRMFYVVCLSALIWTLAGLGFYNVFWIMNLQLPIVSAFVILVITTIGVAMPVAPGFLGNFHYGCILALSLFNIPKSVALAFSLISYVLGICVSIVLGLAFLPSMPISLKEVKDRLKDG